MKFFNTAGPNQTDIYVKWHPDEKNHSVSQKAVIECKLLHKTLEKTLEEGRSRSLFTRTNAVRKNRILSFLTEPKTNPGKKHFS